MTEFGMVTQVVDKHISRGQPRPHPGARPQRLLFLDFCVRPNVLT